MDLIHPPFTLVASDPHCAVRQHRAREFLHYLLQLRLRPRVRHLVLIERPGNCKTILSDRMLRIDTAKEQSYPAARTLQFHCNRLAKAAHRAAQRIKTSEAAAKKLNPDDRATDFYNDEVSSTIFVLSGITYDEPQSAALSASIHLRKWLLAD